MIAGQTKLSPAGKAGLRDCTLDNTNAAKGITVEHSLHRCANKHRERIADHVNEHRIRQASRAFLAAAKRGDRRAQVSAWKRYSTLHAKRSASCIARLEAKLGTRLKRTLKRRIMTAFLHGALPRGCVAAAFRLFSLEEA